MATSTYELIETTTLSSSASSVSFTSITQDYRDLVVVADGVASGNTNGNIILNGDTTGTNYSRVRMRGDGSSTNSGTNSTNTELLEQIGPLGFFAHIQIMDYSATDKHKSMLIRSNKDTTFVYAFAARYANTSAITSVEVSPNSGTFDSGSTFSLYGIAS